jgi:hypothetical protein
MKKVQDNSKTEIFKDSSEENELKEMRDKSQ